MFFMSSWTDWIWSKKAVLKSSVTAAAPVMSTGTVAQCAFIYIVLILHLVAQRYDTQILDGWAEAMCSADEFMAREDGAILGHHIFIFLKHETNRYVAETYTENPVIDSCLASIF